ncbi:MAG: putative toxin-antitoxin system toxin component, PIN family [Armatimonadota bacterium]
MRVVLDTNIFVSALLGGRLGAIVDEWRTGKFTLVVSEPIVREYVAVLQRPKFGIAAEELTATIDYLFKKAEFVSPTQAIDAVHDDPSDNKFLEAAVEGKADFIVSGDAHLLALGTFRDIAIVSGRDFIDRIGAS